MPVYGSFFFFSEDIDHSNIRHIPLCTRKEEKVNMVKKICNRSSRGIKIKVYSYFSGGYHNNPHRRTPIYDLNRRCHRTGVFALAALKRVS